MQVRSPLPSDSPEAPSPKERTMNKHQKTAFGTFAVLAFAFMIALVYSIDGLGMMAVLALTVALLTLPTVWKIIFGFVQLIASAMAFVGHGVGKIGDAVADFAFTRRQSLSVQTDKIPGWDDLNPVKVDADESFVGINELFQPHPAS